MRRKAHAEAANAKAHEETHEEEVRTKRKEDAFGEEGEEENAEAVGRRHGGEAEQAWGPCALAALA